MDAALVVAAIVGVFFAVGLMVGGIVVIALPSLRDRRSRRGRRREPGDRPVQPESGYVDPDDRPRWPEDDDNGHSDR